MQASAHRGRSGGRAAGLALVAALGLGSLGGCRHWGGEWAQAGEPSGTDRPDDRVDILVLGQARDTPVSRAVVAQAAVELDAAAAAGRPALVLWLGDDLGPAGPERSGRCSTTAASTAPPAPLASLTAAAARTGASVWRLPGPDTWRCGRAARGLAEAATPDPTEPGASQPGLASVIRVTADGEVVLASRCDAGRCALVPATRPPRVELVVLDLAPWVFPELSDPATEARATAEQRSLLGALAAAEPAPRILVSTIPVDSAGSRGLGGRRQRTGFRYLPEHVQQALAAGLFVGSVGALERDLQISVDLGNAVHRGDRSFLAAPVFAVVSGAAGGAGHTLPTSRAGALLPDLWSEHPGFAGLRLGADQVELRLLARVASRWRETSVEVPLHPAPHDPLRPAPVIQPCPSCDPQTGAADGDAFVPRPPRPR